MNEQLTQEVNSNNVDGEEPTQNNKENWSLQDQLEEVKMKEKKEFYASKKSSSKEDKQVTAKTCTPETQ